MKLSSKKFTLIALAATCLSSRAAIVISEFRTDQSGADDSEYFELSGNPFESLDGVWYLVIGDGAGVSGTIESVVDLTGQAMGASGYFLAAEATFQNGVGGLFEGVTPNLITSLNFENSDNTTHLLVTDFTGANGDDLDTNDDGILDITPWSLVLDAISPLEETTVPPTATEFAYALSLGGQEVGPDGSFVPAHVYRDGNGIPRVGTFDIALGTDTPGSANIPEPSGGVLMLLGVALICGTRRR